jgi:hypothetical protein
MDDLWGTSKSAEIPIKPSFNARELAKYFQDQFIGAEWHSGFGMVNVQALSGAIAKWKSRTDSATVRAMIDLYMSDASVRGKNPGWTDFLSHAEAINVKLTAKPEEDEWTRLARIEEEEYG